MDVIKKQNMNLAEGSRYLGVDDEIQNSPEPPRKERKLFKKIRRLLPILSIVFYLVLAGAGYYYYRQATDLKKNPQKQQAVLQEEAKNLVANVGRLIVLPQDEEPTIATVSDPEKLKDQPFFASAKAGYKVLIYSKAKKAILYDPESDKIVEVAPLNININPQ